MEKDSTKNPFAQARKDLEAARADLMGASKRAIGDDGKIFFGAAAAIELAVESLTPPDSDNVMAAQSCREALKLAAMTRAHTQGSASNAGKLLEDATKRIAGALKVLET